MAEKYGTESTANGVTTVRAANSIDLQVESATGFISKTIGGVIAEVDDPTLGRGLKHHSGYAGSTFYEKTVAITTTDATATVIFTKAVPLSSTLGVWVQAIGKKVGANADGIVSNKFQAVTNNAATVAVVGTTGGSDVENSSGTPAVTIVANDTTDAIEVKVTGIAAETWAWVAKITVAQVTSSS